MNGPEFPNAVTATLNAHAEPNRDFCRYLNSQWQPTAGGQLRIYPGGALSSDPTSAHGPKGARPHEASTRGVDIAPLLDRLVVFWSDKRCPHEVLPTTVRVVFARSPVLIKKTKLC